MQTNFSEKQLKDKDNQSTEKIFKKWSPAIFLGWSNIGFFILERVF